MNKNLLNKQVFIIFLFSLFIIPIFSAYSEENRKFCLEDDGFVTPLISEIETGNCISQINIAEFKYLINLEQENRKEKLKEFRELAKKQPKKDEKEITQQDVKKVSSEIVKKSSFESEKLKRIAADRERIIENQKKLLEKKRERELKQLEARKINEEKRLKRLAEYEIAKKQWQAKLQADLKARQDARLKKIAEKEKIKQERISRQLALEKEQDLKNKKNIDLADNKANLSKLDVNKKTNNKIQINNNLKIISFKKEIVKHEMFPSINRDIVKWNEKNFDYEEVEKLSVADLKEISNTNNNFVLLIPKDFDVFANNESQNEMMSQVVTGIRQIPNPEFTRLEAEIRDKEKRAMMAKREAEYYEARLNNPYRQSSGIGWLDILSVVAETSGSIKYWDNYRNLTDQVSNLVNQYSNTPMTIDKKMYSSYTYTVNNIKAEKKVTYDAIFFQNEEYFIKDFDIQDNKSFKIVNGLNPQDENYDNLIKKFDSENDLNYWNNAKINTQPISTLLAQLFNENSASEKIGKTEVYKILDSSYEEKSNKSFWKNLFSSKKVDNKKIASLPKNNNYEILDSRFESVVIIKTESGLGSGFYVNDDEILTNYHVVEKSNNITITDKNKNRSSAVLIKKDLNRDLALLKTNAKGKKVIFFSGPIKQGSKVEALGHPRGKTFSVSQGIVSAIRKESSVYNISGIDNVLFIQTDAAINNGNSGGPLFIDERVVGVNTQGLSKKTTEGMNFAIHYSEVLDFLK